MQVRLMILLLLFTSVALAQPCIKYQEAMSAGDRYYNSNPPNLDQALIEYQAAQIAARECGISGDTASLKLKLVFEGLKAQRNQADAARRLAEQATVRAKAALAKADKIISAFYFYDGKLALSAKQVGDRRMYGFINKNGDPVIGYRFETAEQFDYTGFARVTMKDHFGEVGGGIFDYLLDTLGKTYDVDYRVTDSTPTRLSFNTKLISRPWVPAIDLRNKQLDSFPGNIIAYTDLNILLLNNNLLSSLPDSIEKLQKLVTLELSGNNLTTLPLQIGRMRNLVSLNAGNNQLTNLPSAIGELTQLKNLNLTGNRLTALPQEISQLSNLQTLNLYGNQLSTLPSGIIRLKKLENLDLGGNNFTIFPKELLQLENLRVLKLRNHHIDLARIPFNRLTKLHTLDLSDGDVTVLPASITGLKQLRRLYFSGFNVSENEYKRIRRLMPNCEVYNYPLIDLMEIRNLD